MSQNKGWIYIFTIGCLSFFIGCFLFFQNGNKEKVTFLPYSYIGPYSEGYFAVSDGKKMGYVDKNGKVVIPLSYPVTKSMQLGNGELNLQNFAVKYGLFPFPIADSVQQFGLVNKENKTIVKGDSYYKLKILEEDLFLVSQGGKEYFMNRKEKQVGTLSFDEITPLTDTLFLVRDENLYGIANKKEILVPLIYTSITPLFEENGTGIVLSCRKEETKEVYLYEGEQLQLLSLKSPAQPYAFVNKEIYLEGEDHFSIYPIKTGKEVVLNGEYTTLLPFSNNLARVTDQQMKTGYINREEKLVLPYLYDEGSSDGSAYGYVVVVKDGKAGVITETQKEVIPFTYDMITIINEDLFLVYDNYTCFFMNKKQEKVSDVYKQISKTENAHYFKVYDGKNYGIINDRLELVYDLKYSSITVYSDYLLLKVDDGFQLVFLK